MTDTIVGKIPEFTSDETVGEGNEEEVKEAAPEEEPPAEKETPVEPPATNEPAQERDDTGETAKALQALQQEKVKLLQEISNLRGQRREIKQQELVNVESQIKNELEGVHPEDVSLVEKILRSKGYITKTEADTMFYNAVKQDSLTAFLEKYPEYKPENDPSDTNWSSLQRELGYYRMPDDPHKIQEVLERAHRAIARPPSERSVEVVKKRQIQVAGVGAQGIQRSSSKKSLDPERRTALERGGWSEEEIKKIEQNLE